MGRNVAIRRRGLFSVSVLLLVTFCCAAAQPCPSVGSASLPDGLCANVYANLNTPRQAALTSEGDLVVLARGTQSIVLLRDVNGDGVIGHGEQHTIASGNGLNHAILLDPPYLYASSETVVYRWPFNATQQHLNPSTLGTGEVIVAGLPGQGHSTRTLLVAGGYLYVSIGSGGNVDSDSSRARVIRFDLTSIPHQGYQGTSAADVFADGLRNEVGLAVDPATGLLWGVENGADQLNRADIGGDIHNDNPAEEVNLFRDSGNFYGYPYCWTEYKLPPQYSQGRGTQWAWPSFMGDGVHTDAWCRNTSNVQPPAFSMQAHSAPLDITFYNSTGRFAMSAHMRGGAFVALHGSWNRNIPVGYKVAFLEFDDARNPTNISDFFYFNGSSPTSGDTGPGWAHRPVSVVVGVDGDLFVTSDRSGVVLRIWRNASCDFVCSPSEAVNPPTPSPSPPPSDATDANTILIYGGGSIGIAIVLCCCAALVRRKRNKDAKQDVGWKFQEDEDDTAISVEMEQTDSPEDMVQLQDTETRMEELGKSPPGDPVPGKPGWYRAIDPSTHLPYIWNAETKETHWGAVEDFNPPKRVEKSKKKKRKKKKDKA